MQPQFPRLPELLDAGHHARMAQGRLRPIGAEQAIPPRQVEAKIAVSFAPVDRMMHTVHVRCDHDPTQHAIETGGQPHIAMVEHGCRVQHDLKHQHGHRWRPKDQDRRELDEHGQDDLARMEPQARGDIEFQVRMVHAVQSPEPRHGMKGHVLGVDEQIEQEHGCRNGKPGRDVDKVEQTPTLRLSDKGHSHRRKREQQAHDDGVQHNKAEIVRPAEKAPHRLCSPRRQHLPYDHQQQHAQEAAQPDDRLSRDDGVRHARLPP
jgi:hypothetical protein